jgi:hypothetical protein
MPIVIHSSPLSQARHFYHVGGAIMAEGRRFSSRHAAAWNIAYTVRATDEAAGRVRISSEGLVPVLIFWLFQRICMQYAGFILPDCGCFRE